MGIRYTIPEKVIFFIVFIKGKEMLIAKTSGLRFLGFSELLPCDEDGSLLK